MVDDGRGFCLRLVRWVLDCERNDMSPGLSLLHIRYGGLPTATKEVTEIINQVNATSQLMSKAPPSP